MLRNAAVRTILIAAVVLVLCAGDSIRPAADEMEPGPVRTVVAAVGAPAGWIAERLPFAAATDAVVGWFRPGADDDGASAAGAASGAGGNGSAGADGSVARVAPQAFAATALGERPVQRRLATLLVTGDSMAQPLDAVISRRLADVGVRTTRDIRLGSGISKEFVVDWAQLSAEQAAELKPDAVAVFLGANEGFPIATGSGEVRCCGTAWAAAYATRARAMMERYRRDGAGQVFWLLVPAPRDPERARVARAVNAAIRVAAGPFGAQVAVVDSAALFTPGGRFRSAMPVGGREQIVRNPDGIHLNEQGAELLADVLQRRLGESFTAFGDGTRR